MGVFLWARYPCAPSRTASRKVAERTADARSYTGTSLIRNPPPVGLCSRPMPRAVTIFEGCEALSHARDTGGAQFSGDTTPCKVTPVILHGVVSPAGVTLHGVVFPEVQGSGSTQRASQIGQFMSVVLTTNCPAKRPVTNRHFDQIPGRHSFRSPLCGVVWGGWAQGYLAHKKLPPPRTLQ